MLRFLLFLLLCVHTPNVQADEMDLLTGEFIIGDASSENNVSTGTKENNEKEQDQENGGIFGFITNPVKNLFNKSEAGEAVEVNGEDITESPLQKSIRLAEEGSLADQLNLAYMYLYGQKGIEKDAVKAFNYYKMAAEQNDATAIGNLASLYYNGIGTERNEEKALELFDKAANLGDDNAAINLAFMYLRGGAKDVQRNQKVFGLFEMAAKKGNKIAQFMLGYAYYKGFTQEPNYKQAFKLIKSAAGGEAQIDEAQIVLAEMYVKGFGTVQNYSKAIAAYRAAAEQGSAEAAVILADIYKEGKFTLKQPITAHALYNIASAMGDAVAAQKRDEISEILKIEELNQAQDIAQNYEPKPSSLSQYVHQSFGENIRSYIDNNMTK